MYPGFFGWMRAQHHGGGCGSEAGFHGGHRHEGHGHSDGGEMRTGGEDWSGDGGALGVRRPLRFLAYKLGLGAPQVAELARILAELKTERAQAAVDQRRTLASIADLVAAAAFDNGKAEEATALRVKSAERVRDAVVKALGKIHALLDERQRSELAYLIRTGTLTI